MQIVDKTGKYVFNEIPDNSEMPLFKATRGYREFNLMYFKIIVLHLELLMKNWLKLSSGFQCTTENAIT